MIPLVDLKKQYKTIRKDVNRAIQGVIENTDFILGKELVAFEEEFAKFCDVKHAVGVDSGTGALELALHALDIKQGDEVIVPSFTFYATASAVCTVGAKPVFCDVDDETGNIDPAKIEALITPKTKAIIPVHLFGQPADLNQIMKIASKHNLPVIEDTAQAHGSRIKIEPSGKWEIAGSQGIMGCFSFYPGKNLGAYGDGGMVVTNRDDVAQKLRLLRDYGRTGKYEHSILGFNRRLDTLQAAVLRVKLKKLNAWNKARRERGTQYDQLFNKIGVRTFKVKPFAEPVRHVYAIRVERRDALLEFLKQNEIYGGVHYPVPLHLQKAFAHFGYKKGDLPVSEKMAEEIMSLPMYPELKTSEVKQIAGLVKAFLAPASQSKAAAGSSK